MKRAAVLVGSLVCAFLFGAGAAEKINAPLPPEKLAAFQTCASDSDCVYVKNGCCDCANGGQETAVNKKQLADFQAQFDCARVACMEEAAMPPCGSGVVSCAAGVCAYTKLPGASVDVSVTTPNPCPAGNKRFPEVWTHTITHPHAKFIAVHFARFSLPSGDSLTIYDQRSRTLASYGGRGPKDGDDFWGAAVEGEKLKLVLRAGPGNPDAGSGSPTCGIVIDKYAYVENPPKK